MFEKGVVMLLKFGRLFFGKTVCMQIYINGSSFFLDFCLEKSSLFIQIETRNNKLEMQSVNNKSLIEELDKLLERLRVPSEVFFLSSL